MIPVPEIIRKKRDGGEHSLPELQELLTGYLQGEVKDYQMAAWLMAVFFRGLTPAETAAWTALMWKSGVTFPRETRGDFWIDKHSTGGVGDKTSLILVPLVTACAQRLFGPGKVKMPMVSGRGLGHSGGTLDKLESVPGFSTSIPIARARELLAENDFFMMGQTAELAPADRLLYALRDVTATVECVPLIVSSILSKKLSENLDGLVLDVKFGRGAFMRTRESARSLAEGIIQAARSQGMVAVALLTAMDEPLGWTVGNLLEVMECEDYLSGIRREAGLHEVTLALAGAMISMASQGKLTRADATAEIERELELPTAGRLYRRMFEAQGGNWEAYRERRRAQLDDCLVSEMRALSTGFVTEIDALAIGQLVRGLGGGRSRKDDAVDDGVGVEFLKKTGGRVQAGEVWAKVFCRNQIQLAEIKERWAEAVKIEETASPAQSWVTEICG